uniref:RanBP2-type zinc finger protein At1g67325 n=1 Tax=Anthurium amnicola TaxID=1678845 RepID=A0A1D1YPF7_9ARAE
MGEGREGDWECSGCRNRNYAFRSFCNRCKQPRLLVDTKTPADSKWLPRIGDWICVGCSNNNYASRDKCKKCGQPKEEAAMPALAMPGSSLPYAHHFARAQGVLGLKTNFGMAGSSVLHQSLAPNSNWPYGSADKYELQSVCSWPSTGNVNGVFPYTNNTSHLLGVPKGWRIGDWICNCGFHNYSSRAQCKKCSAPSAAVLPSSVANSAVTDLFPTLGTKRLASEEFVNEWDSKRLNAGDKDSHFLTYGQKQLFQGFEQLGGSSNCQTLGMYSKYPSGSSASVATLQMHVQSPQPTTMPTILGKGAKQWRDGDWMCSHCNNHNFASRSFCNRCKTQREGISQPVSVA